MIIGIVLARRGPPLPLLLLLLMCLSFALFRPVSALQAVWSPRRSRGGTSGATSSTGWTHATAATHLPAAAAGSGGAAPKAPSKAATKKAGTAAKKKAAAVAAVPPPPPSPPQPALEAMKKADLIASVVDKTGLSKKAAEDAISAVVQTIQDGVASNKKVALPGFGTFAPRSRAARVGRNPQTGAELQIAASIAPTFTASKVWKDSLNDK